MNDLATSYVETRYVMNAALRRGPSCSAVARLLGTDRSVRIRRERVHFSASRPVQLALRVESDGGAQAMIWAEFLGGEADRYAEAERISLCKSRRGQVVDDDHGGILADRQSGFVLRRAGLDNKLPGLRLLYDPGAASDLVARIDELDIAPEALQVNLVAHRLGKRAVLRIDGPGGYLRYARLRATKSQSGRKSFDNHVALWRSLCGTEMPRVPEPVGFDPKLGMAVFKSLSGSVPEFSGLAGYRACRDICIAIEALQALGIHASGHTPRDEMEILKGWIGWLRVYEPERVPAISDALSVLAEDMIRLSDAPSVPCHRDLHEKQILLSDRGAGLLDFDTLRLGDPALDIGNLQAHLYLAGQRGGRSLATFEDALLLRADTAVRRRVRIWRRSALLRMATIYAFTDEPRVTIDALVREARVRGSQ